jgi:hypothetical protein
VTRKIYITTGWEILGLILEEYVNVRRKDEVCRGPNGRKQVSINIYRLVAVKYIYIYNMQHVLLTSDPDHKHNACGL